MLHDSLGKELNELNKQPEKKEVWIIFLLLYSDYAWQEPYNNFSQILRSLRWKGTNMIPCHLSSTSVKKLMELQEKKGGVHYVFI
jgi:hypothetical protein